MENMIKEIPLEATLDELVSTPKTMEEIKKQTLGDKEPKLEDLQKKVEKESSIYSTMFSTIKVGSKVQVNNKDWFTVNEKIANVPSTDLLDMFLSISDEKDEYLVPFVMITDVKS